VYSAYRGGKQVWIDEHIGVKWSAWGGSIREDIMPRYEKWLDWAQFEKWRGTVYMPGISLWKIYNKQLLMVSLSDECFVIRGTTLRHDVTYQYLQPFILVKSRVCLFIYLFIYCHHKTYCKNFTWEEKYFSKYSPDEHIIECDLELGKIFVCSKFSFELIAN
jgi:hypothetical protein